MSHEIRSTFGTYAEEDLAVLPNDIVQRLRKELTQQCDLLQRVEQDLRFRGGGTAWSKVRYALDATRTSQRLVATEWKARKTEMHRCYADYFIDEAKRTLDPETFSSLANAARRLQKEHE